MNNIKADLQKTIEQFFCIKKEEISAWKKLRGSNLVYAFVVNRKKYVIKTMSNVSISNWEHEKAAYHSLAPLNITDELVYYDKGIRISKYLDGGKKLSYGEADMVDALALLRSAHECGASINHQYDIIENMNQYMLRCDKKSNRLNELRTHLDTISTIQQMVNRLNVRPVLCHGDACVNGNFLRLPDGSIRMIDWEQAGMADPLLDLAIASLHQGLEKVDPVWCLHHYLKRTPEKQEYLRLFSFLALNSFALMAWCIYADPGSYNYYRDIAVKYSRLVLKYYCK